MECTFFKPTFSKMLQHGTDMVEVISGITGIDQGIIQEHHDEPVYQVMEYLMNCTAGMLQGHYSIQKAWLGTHTDHDES